MGPLYLGLGVLAGVVAAIFERATTTARESFADEAGLFSGVPASLRPFVGGVLCGALGLAFPQVLFFGYSTINEILATGGDALGTDTLVVLLFAKIAATSLCIGSGLVGGTFAPSLFFGAVLGAAYQDIAGGCLAGAADALQSFQTSIGVVPGSWGVLPQLTIADVPAYATVGAAATLASVFRAPLTASLLLFELTRGYDIVLPLLVAAGIGPLVKDLLLGRFGRLFDEPDCSENVAVVIPSRSLREECDIDNKVVCTGNADDG